jgi:serine/threonine-protein kinase
MEIMTGFVLGNRYEVGELLGQGGMALVYKAQDRVLGRPVAIKVLRPEYTGDANLVERFQREARAAANLVYPNIVAVHDVGQEADRYYIVMEYVPGPTLKDVIRQRAPLPVEFALKVAEQVCAALEYAHRHNVIHRDIKPQNILLSEDEEVVKVTDFGIAKSTLDPETTTERLALGTVKYISPEQARGVQVVPQSDLYSLGVVLYEMLTGEQPFDGETPVSIAHHHVESRPRPLRQLNPYLPPAVEGIVLRALAKNPGERFASARELRATLERYRLAGAEVTGPIPQPLPQRPANAAVGGRPAPFPPGETTPPAAYTPRRPTAVPRPQSGLGAMGVILLILIAAGLVGLVVMGRELWPAFFKPAPTPLPTATTPPTPLPQVIVPDVKGLAREEACAQLEQFHLNCAEGETRYDPYTPPGRVIAQEPTYGISVDQGTVVTLHLGATPGLATVPSVAQMSLMGAKLVLEQAGFRVQQAEVGCVSTPPGYVDSQEPPAGRQDIQGITVTVYVSVGDQSVLPELLRVPLEEARRRITEAGLVLQWEQPQTQADMQPGVDIDNLGRPGEVISYIITYGGRNYSSGERRPGDKVPCGAMIVVGYYATAP